SRCMRNARLGRSRRWSLPDVHPQRSGRQDRTAARSQGAARRCPACEARGHRGTDAGNARDQERRRDRHAPRGGGETMTDIVGIAGSLRRGSYNLGLLKAAETLMPDSATLDVRTIAGIPLFNADDEAAAGLPPAVVAIKDAIAAADGLVLATPEYNNGIPG